MKKYRGKNVVAVVSSFVLGVSGIVLLILCKGPVVNIISIALVLLSLLEVANYIKYSIVLDSEELRIDRAIKGKKVRYKDIVKIFSVNTGKVRISYIIDKYHVKGKWYIRGTYPPVPQDNLSNADFNNLSEVISINSFNFQGYKDILAELSKKVNFGCDIDGETWKIINLQ